MIRDYVRDSGNVINVYLTSNGSGDAYLVKNFTLYKGSYQNKLLDIYVPKSLLFNDKDGLFNYAVSISALMRAENGSQVTTDAYYMNYLKTISVKDPQTQDLVEYVVFERLLPKEFVVFAGTTQMLINILNVDSTKNNVLSIVTTQITNLAVQESAYVRDETIIEPTKIEEINSKITTNQQNFSILQTRTTTLETQVATNTQDITENRNNIDILKQTIGTGEDYVGTMVVSALPTDTEINDFVQSIRGRKAKGGDTVIVVLQVAGDTDKNYKYIYNGTNWTSYEIPPIELASNGTHGLIEGTYGVENYNTLVDISGGQVRDIYIKGNDGQYKNLQTYVNMNSQDIEDIITGDTQVGEAMKAIQDGVGNNIVDTYLTQVLGATKQFVRDYAQPREFSNVYYISTSGYSTQIPTTPESGVQFTTNTNAVGSFQMFQLEKTNEASYEITSTNGYSNNFQISASKNCQVQFRLTTECQKSGGDWINLNTDLTNIITINENDIVKVQIGSQFLSLGDVVLMLDTGDKIRQTLEVVTQTSSSLTFNLYSNSVYPSTFSITSQSYIISDIDQAKSQIIMIGADGIIESGNVVMTVQNAESFIEYRTNQREFLLNGNVSVVGKIDNTYPIRIEFGDTIYNLYSFLKGGNTPLTFGDIASSIKYSAETGYSFDIRVIFIQTSDISGFVLNPITLTADEVSSIISDDSSVVGIVGNDGKLNLMLDAELQAKLMQALVTPRVAPTNTELVGVDNANSQTMISLGQEFKIENDSLKLSGEVISNPNLLINGDFRVNQRGQTSYTGSNQYTVDRWRLHSVGTVTVNSNYTITYTIGVNNWAGLNYYIEKPSFLSNKTVTLSLKGSATGGIWSSVYHKGTSIGGSYTRDNGDFYLTSTFTFGEVLDSDSVMIRLTTQNTSMPTGVTNNTFTLEYVKLELGSIATAFSPRPYAEELANCQRYYQVITTRGTGSGTATPLLGLFSIQLINTLRTKPTIALKNDIYIRGNSGNKLAYDITYNTFGDNLLIINASAENITTNNIFWMSSGSITLDAEIY